MTNKELILGILLEQSEKLFVWLEDKYLQEKRRNHRKEQQIPTFTPKIIAMEALRVLERQKDFDFFVGTEWDKPIIGGHHEGTVRINRLSGNSMADGDCDSSERQSEYLSGK